MKEIYSNERLRVRSRTHTQLDMLLITVMAAMPFLPYVLSAGILIVISFSVLLIKQTRDAVRAHMRMYSVVLAITAVSTISSIVWKNVIGLWVTLGIFLVLTFAVYVRTVMNRQLFKRVIYVNCGGTLLSLVAVLFQRIREPNPEYRPTGFAYNANYLGSIAVLSALLALIAFFEDWKEARDKRFIVEKIMYVFTVLANGIIILICESRSSLLAIMAGVFVLLLLKKKFILCGLCALGGVGIWLLGYLNPEVFGWANSLVFVFTQRFGIWICALDKFISSPLIILIGMGPMGYRFAWHNGKMSEKWLDAGWLSKQDYLRIPDTEAAYYKYMTDISTANHAHNLAVDILINVGVIGAVLYLVLCRSFLRSAFKKLKSGDRTAFITTIVAISAVLVQGIPDVTIMWHQTATLFVIMCASRYQKAE